MTARQTAILKAIEAGSMWGISAADIAYTVSAPEPSVRRSIQELIAQGHNISYAANGLYYWRKGY